MSLATTVDREIRIRHELGRMVAPGTLRLERVLPGPIERVWDCLTRPELRRKWLAAGEMQMRVGGRVELIFNHAELSPVPDPIPAKYAELCPPGAGFSGRVTQFEPPRLLSYTWGGDSEEASEVTFELTPRDKDVLFVLTHRRLGSRDERLSVAGGWHAHVDILIDYLEGRTPPGFWSTHALLEAEYDRRLG